VKLTKLDQSAKERVIIVLGTWVEPIGKIPAVPAASITVPRTRGLSANLTPHCMSEALAPGAGRIATKAMQFQWSGENSWIARTQTASKLGDIAKLQTQGWRCHIVAHSRGGNERWAD
jgi:hypothetical protein